MPPRKVLAIDDSAENRKKLDEGFAGKYESLVLDGEPAFPADERGVSRLRLLTDAIPAGLAAYACSDSGIRILYFNTGFCGLLGFTREEYEPMTEKNPVTAVFAEDLPLLLGQVEEIKRSGAPIDCTYRIHTADGGFKWVNLRGLAEGMRGGELIVNVVLQDVTPAKLIEEELRLRDAELRLVVEHSERVIYRYNLATHRAVSVEREASRALGLPEFVADMPESLIEQGIIIPEDAQYVRGLFATARTKKGSDVMRFRARGGDGSIRWLDVKYTFLGDGEVSEAVISCLDVTEQHEREVAFARYRQSTEADMLDSGLYFETDISADIVEKAGGDLPLPYIDPVGKTHTEVTRQILTHNFLPENRDSAARFLSREHLLMLYADGQRELAEEWQVKFSDGSLHWMSGSLQMVADPFTGHIKVFTLLRDVTSDRQDIMDIKKRASTDGMTGLYNRATAEEAIRAALASDTGNCALMMLDLDDLKGINDNLGHAQGDAAIKTLASVLASSFRKTDIIARAGGDEFMVFLRGVADEACLSGVTASLLRKISAKSVGERRLSCSVGCAFGVCGADSFETLFDRADTALYHVKRSGKNGCSFYTPDMKLKAALKD